MTNILYLDDLRKGCSGILPSLGSFMCDCAIFSLASQGHSSLEVSGIRKASRTNSIASRHKLKIEQVKQSASSGLEVYIAITEFSKPHSLFVTK
jgi:hypothetical protein